MIVDNELSLKIKKIMSYIYRKENAELYFSNSEMHDEIRSQSASFSGHEVITAQMSDYRNTVRRGGFIPIIFSAIKEIIASEKVESLTLSGWVFSELDCSEILNLCLTCKMLKRIKVFEMTLTPENIARLSAAPSLEELEISFGCKGFDDLSAQLLSRSQSLRTLSLFRTFITDQGLRELNKIKTLERLELCHSYTGLEGILHLLSSTTLKFFEIEDDFDDGDMKKVYEVHLSPTLERIKIGSYGALQEPDKVFTRSKLPVERTGSNFQFKIVTGENTGMPCMSEFESDTGDTWDEDTFENYFSIQTGEKLREILLKYNYNPNTYSLTYDLSGQVNPILNYHIANEDYFRAIQIISAFPELDPNLKDYQGKTALITAAKHYRGDNILLALIQYHREKIDFNAQDENGCTALHYVCAYGKLNLAKALLEAGSDYSLLDKKGRTAFDYVYLLPEEIKFISESIVVPADRDSGASQNQFNPVTLKEDKPYSSEHGIMITAENVRKAILDLDESGFSRIYPAQAGKLSKRYHRILQSLSGKSVLEMSLENRKELIRNLLDPAPSLFETVATPVFQSIGLQEQQKLVMQYLYCDHCREEDRLQSLAESPPVVSGKLWKY